MLFVSEIVNVTGLRVMRQILFFYVFVFIHAFENFKNSHKLQETNVFPSPAIQNPTKVQGFPSSSVHKHARSEGFQSSSSMLKPAKATLHETEEVRVFPTQSLHKLAEKELRREIERKFEKMEKKAIERTKVKLQTTPSSGAGDYLDTASSEEEGGGDQAECQAEQRSAVKKYQQCMDRSPSIHDSEHSRIVLF